MTTTGASDLPVDVLKLIYDNLLNWIDRVKFSGVCKSWNTVHLDLNTQPFLMNYNGTTCTFRGSPLQKCYWKSFCGGDVIASRKGWLLIKHGELFFYNPFTSLQIMLPSFDPGSNIKAIFSDSPTSPNCVIFVVRSTGVSDNFVTTNFCNYCDPCWKQCRLRVSNVSACKDLALSEGKLYLFFDKGILGILSIENYNWTVVASPLMSITRPPIITTYFGFTHKSVPKVFELKNFHIMECDGEIMLVCTCTGFLPFFIFELDKKKEDWVEITSLKNRAIFLNDDLSSSFAIYAGTPNLRNKVFYFHENSGTFVWTFNLETRSHSLSDLYPPSMIRGSKQVWIYPPS